MARNIDQWYHHTVDSSPLRAHYYGNNIASNPLHYTDDVSQQLIIDSTSTALLLSNGLLSGKQFETTSRDISLKESDSESVTVTALELTDGAMVTMPTQEDSDLKFFDALDRSIKMTSPVTMTTEKFEMLTFKEKELLTSSLITSKVLLASDEDQLNLNNGNNHQPNVRKYSCLYDNIIHYTHIQNDWVATDNFLASCEPTIRKRRVTISPKPNVRLNLWTFMKNSIGKDLSRIPLPVSMCAYLCTFVGACMCAWLGVSMCMCTCVCMYAKVTKLHEELKFTKLYQTTVYSLCEHCSLCYEQ